MSPLELDDSINGSIVGKTASDTTRYMENEPKMLLRDKVIKYVIEKGKASKSDILLHISGSGTAQFLITNLVRSGVFVEHFYECNHCKYFTVDKTKVNTV